MKTLSCNAIDHGWRAVRVWLGVAALAAVWQGAGAAEPPPVSAPEPTYAGGAPYLLTVEETASLRARHAELAAKMRELEGQAAPDLVADVAIYAKAAEYLLRFPDRVFRKDYVKDALDLCAIGLQRADELQRGVPSWINAHGFVCRGYRSKVDGSYQPYCVGIPDNYNPNQPARLDIILHGRSKIINEVSFLTSGTNGRIVTTESGRKAAPDCLKLYVFGRGNTSYRWAGEADVFEAESSVRARYSVDPERIVLRGFSMGGVGAWHLGLHFPSRWAAVEAGAGYVETRPQVLTTIHDPWRIESLAIHDASNCALNLIDLPFVAYAGSQDPIRLDHEKIRQKLGALGYDVDHLPRALFMTGAGFGHQFGPEYKKRSDAFISAALPRRRPENFRFVTYTPSYGEFWDFHVDSLDHLYSRAELSGKWDQVRTSNVWVLDLDRPRHLELDGQPLTGASFYKSDGVWHSGEPDGLRKRAGLQGPIDDAFQQPFLCVEPDGGSDLVLARFREDFARYLYGDIRVAAAGAVTDSDVANYNLILFGDADNNPWIRRVLPRLPLRWTHEEIAIAGRTFPAKGNTVALIYPNPLNPKRYVVLNSGHTFPGRDFDDMHWFLHPRLGDYAVLDAKTRAVRLAGFFDRAWQPETSRPEKPRE